MKNKFLKPKMRSSLRIRVGKIVYTLRRYMFWYFSGTRFALCREQSVFKNTVFTHSTPLFRELSGVSRELQRNKKNNLQIACGKIDGVIIRPGETFSYWRLIGRISAGKGYLPGMFLFYGNVIERTGGGLCQLSNLIYWMTLHTPLTVTERYRHSYDVFPDSRRTQPFGSGATCVFNYRDLMIYNGTDSSFQLKVKVHDDILSGEWLSDGEVLSRYEVYEKEHSITHEVWGKYVRHNLIYRKKFDTEGNLLVDEYVAENHALMMYDPFIEK